MEIASADASYSSRSGVTARPPHLETPYNTKRLRQGIKRDHFRVKQNMPNTGGIQSVITTPRTIADIEAMLLLKKGFCFSGDWTVNDQNNLLACLSGLQEVHKA